MLRFCNRAWWRPVIALGNCLHWCMAGVPRESPAGQLQQSADELIAQRGYPSSSLRLQTKVTRSCKPALRPKCTQYHTAGLDMKVFHGPSTLSSSGGCRSCCGCEACGN
ncbi:hypothetical protein C8Q74DRAFT_393618 [Fomes fomentarius]|nr:hypothetical protein C8Q74DRAFT_393618 [Fomes fomentarius]